MRAKMGAAWDKLSPRQKSWTMAATVALISVTAGYGLSQRGESGSQANGNGGSSGGAVRADCRTHGSKSMKNGSIFSRATNSRSRHTIEDLAQAPNPLAYSLLGDC